MRLARLLCVLALVCLLPRAAHTQEWADALCGRSVQGEDRDAQNVTKLIVQNAPVYEPVTGVVVDRPLVDAQAHHCLDGSKLVIFGKTFLQRVRNTAKGTGPYWSWVFVAAHEIGHISRNHGNIRLPCVPEKPNDAYCRCHAGMSPDEIGFNHSLELEADFFAGFVLSQSGASREEALSAVHVLNSHDTCTHPSRSKRVEAVTRGWLHAQGGSRPGGLRGTTTDLAQFSLIANRDIYGGDIRELFGISIEACARQCLDNDRCAMFSFDRWYNACFLKSKFKIAERFSLDGFPQSRRLTASDLILKREPKSTIGIRRDLMDAEPGIDTRGTEIIVRLKGRAFFDRVGRTAHALDWADCAAACRADGQRCTAFNFFDKTCELFELTDGHYPAPERSVGYIWVQNR